VSHIQQDHLRPVNLQTDLGELADLIELVFRDVMDESGRAAIREMRMLSRAGLALPFLGRMNALAAGISLGYVWEEDDKIIGNVSIYPAHWPTDLGGAWIIANVGVHPSYQRRGIARYLMHASLELIRMKGGKHTILQVDYDNHGAIHLYEQLGFIRERAFTIWSRSALTSAPAPLDDSPFITRRRPSNWEAEYDLARRTRSNEHGGIGWLKPVHRREFSPGIWARLQSWFAFTSRERLVVRGASANDLLASLWVENSLGLTRSRLILLNDPNKGTFAAEALLNNLLRRTRSTSFTLEHPHDDEAINDLLMAYRFRRLRTVWHMRLDM